MIRSIIAPLVPIGADWHAVEVPPTLRRSGYPASAWIGPLDAARALYRVRGVYLVRGRAGKPANYTTVALQWRKAVKAAGVPDAQLRDIRPKSITDADMQGRQAQALAGHATPAMTQRYIRRRRTPVVEGPSIRQPSKTA